MEILRIPRITQDSCKKHLQRGRSLGFVPTMGALHDGHLSLVKRAKMENDVTIVSIFLNPLQFGPAEDLEKYPRDIDEDIRKLREEDIDILFLPDNNLMYPRRFFYPYRSWSPFRKTLRQVQARPLQRGRNCCSKAFQYYKPYPRIFRAEGFSADGHHKKNGKRPEFRY